MVIVMAKTNKKVPNIEKDQINRLKKVLGIKKIEDIEPAILKELKESFKYYITDTRQKGKITYKIWDIIMYVILANFSDVYDWEEIHDFIKIHQKWLRSFLLMTGGIPTEKTIENIFSIISPKELETVLVSFYKSLIGTTKDKDLVNIDGRVDRGSSRNKTDYNEKKKPLNVLNAYSNKYGICLASEEIEDKTNEIPTIPDILDRFNVKGVIITWDALNTQTKNVETVVKKGGDYVVPIKENQGNFYHDLELYFKDLVLEQMAVGNNTSAYQKQIEKSHSAIITYEYFQTSDIDWYFEKDKWTGLSTIGLVKKTIEKNSIITVEKRYYISSLNVNIVDFSNAIRNHWCVENKLHWHLDFTFREDSNTTVNKQALMNLQIVNKFILGILNQVKVYYNKSLKKIRNLFSMDYENQFIYLLCYLAFC